MRVIVAIAKAVAAVVIIMTGGKIVTVETIDVVVVAVAAALEGETIGE